MKKLLLIAGALLIVAVPAMAGEGAKCTADLKSCLSQWSKGRDKGWLGLKYDQSDGSAMAVKEVQAGSPAAAAGFRVGDVMVALNGASFADKDAVKKAKGDWKVGQSVTYTVKREGAEKTIAVTLASMPDEVFAAMVGRHMIENHFETATATSENSAEAASTTKAVKEDKK